MLKRLLVAALLLLPTSAHAAFDAGDIICETTTTTGTGTVTLGGAVSNYATFASQITSGSTVNYHIRASSGTLETGVGVFTDAASDTLTRVAYWSTDGSGAELTLPAGTHTVCLGPTTQMFAAQNGTQLYVADDGATGAILPLQHDSGSAADGDLAAQIQVFAGADDEQVALQSLEVDDGATTSEDTHWEFTVRVAGADVQLFNIGAVENTVGWGINSAGHFVPGTDATYDIGTSTVGINDLHFGSGGIINFDGGDVTFTHAGINRMNFEGGRLAVGTGAPVDFGFFNGFFQLLGTDNDSSAFGLTRGSADASGANFAFYKSSDAGAAIGTTPMAANDELGSIRWAGTETSGVADDGASIRALADAAWGSGGDTSDVPTRIEFRNAPDGSDTLAVRMTIKNDGGIILGSGTTSPGTNAILFPEVTAPTGVANSGILYAVDNGSGKTQLVVIFGSGAAQVIATEP